MQHPGSERILICDALINTEEKEEKKIKSSVLANCLSYPEECMNYRNVKVLVISLVMKGMELLVYLY